MNKQYKEYLEWQKSGKGMPRGWTPPPQTGSNDGGYYMKDGSDWGAVASHVLNHNSAADAVRKFVHTVEADVEAGVAVVVRNLAMDSRAAAGSGIGSFDAEMA